MTTRADRVAALMGLGYDDLLPGDLIQVRSHGGLRDARITGRGGDGTPLFRSQVKTGRRSGEWEPQRPLRREEFECIWFREGS